MAECGPFLAFAQLYARDVPDLAPPPHADLLQVLWCPWDHDDLSCPAVILRWRRADEVTVALDPQPEPELMEYGAYLPDPCVLYPEQIVEYQYADFLPADLHRRLRVEPGDRPQLPGPVDRLRDEGRRLVLLAPHRSLPHDL
ncbi:hypothetical protein ACFQY7_17270 [Actinomadura luteofluorescens]|uniref:hypothetical protein n=1 Tax=Actinomadura luteofluorescens TaxID=46163 RepID=UPI003624D343